jgi:hypothetical protein
LLPDTTPLEFMTAPEELRFLRCVLWTSVPLK